MVVIPAYKEAEPKANAIEALLQQENLISVREEVTQDSIKIDVFDPSQQQKFGMLGQSIAYPQLAFLRIDNSGVSLWYDARDYLKVLGLAEKIEKAVVATVTLRLWGSFNDYYDAKKRRVESPSFNY